VTAVAVLCGGRATRLGERARTTPKLLIEVAGKPFAAHLLPRLAACGLDDVVLLVGHLEAQIRAALGDGSAFGVHLRYVSDGPTQRGTRGAIEGALDVLGDTFLVTYGDSYLPFDYRLPLHTLEARDGLACMSVYPNQGRIEPSNVAVAGDRVVTYRKGTADPSLDHIDYGAVAFRRQAFGPPEGGDLAPLLGALAARGELAAAIVTERFYEVGSEGGIADLERHLGFAAEEPPR
jgi:MurNAc alpha-1-phosphate uridylyltransferase